MKIIAPSVEIMRTGLEIEATTPEQFIERVGRTCYKSEDKITDDSAAKFVSNLIKRGHEAMIEHWNLIFKTDPSTYETILQDWDLLLHHGNIPTKERLRPYLRFTDCQGPDGETRCIISANMRAWRDFVKACVEGFGFIPRYLHGLINNYPLFFPEYQDYVPIRFINDILIPIYPYDLIGDVELGTHMNVTVKFICDRGVSHELVRHRVASFAQESTRYCVYRSNITVIRPSWCEEGSDVYNAWMNACMRAEEDYFTLLDNGASAQEARSALPNSLKTEVIVTMNLNDWEHFFSLRCDSHAHPDMQEVATMADTMFDMVVYPEYDTAVERVNHEPDVSLEV